MAAPADALRDQEVQDLGAFDGPTLVFGGAYSNLQALEGVLAAARELGVPPRRLVHTGDAVAYCAQPRETVELLMESGAHSIMGNCEESIAGGKSDCGCGFPEDSKCNEYSVNWFAHVMRQLESHEHLRDWMGRLPRRIEFVLGGRRFAVVHGSPRHISEFLWPSTPDAELQACFAGLRPEIDGVICGHSGIPFARLVPQRGEAAKGDQRLWLNAGVVGMPANDGTSRGWFALLTPKGAGDVEVSIRALHYPAKQAADAIYAETTLVRGYADALLSGIWPSHDILPLEEQMGTGAALAEGALLWPAAGGAGAAAKTAEHISTDTNAAPAEAVVSKMQGMEVTLAATTIMAVLATSFVACWWLRGTRIAR